MLLRRSLLTTLAVAGPVAILAGTLGFGESYASIEPVDDGSEGSCVTTATSTQACRIDLPASRRSALKIVLPHTLPEGALSLEFTDESLRQVHHRPLVLHPDQTGLAKGQQRWVLLFADHLVPFAKGGELSLVHAGLDGSSLRASLASGDDLTAINSLWQAPDADY